MKKLFQSFIFLCLTLNLVNASALTIRFGIGYFYPPFEYLSSAHQSYGYDMEVVQALCAQINAQCTFTTMKLSDMFQNLNQGTVDAVIGAISITPAREQEVDFTQPYYQNSVSFVGKEASHANTLDFNDVTIGVAQSTTFVNYLNLLYPGKVTVKVYPTTEDVLAALAENDVDLIMLDTPVADYWVNNGGAQFKIVGKAISDSQLLGAGYAIAVKKGNVALLTVLNQGLMAIKANGTLTAINQKYFTKL